MERSFSVAATTVLPSTGTDHIWIGSPWCAIDVFTRPVAVFVLMTSFQRDRCDSSQQGIRKLAPFCAARAKFVQSKEVMSCSASRRPRYRSPRPREGRKRATGSAFFSLVARRCTARPGHFTTFPWLPIQTLFHSGIVV